MHKNRIQHTIHPTRQVPLIPESFCNLPRVGRIGRFDRVNPQPVSDGAQFLLSVRVYSSHDYAKSAGVTVKLQVSVFNLNQWQPTVDCS